MYMLMYLVAFLLTVVYLTGLLGISLNMIDDITMNKKEKLAYFIFMALPWPGWAVIIGVMNIISPDFLNKMIDEYDQDVAIRKAQLSLVGKKNNDNSVSQ